MVLLSTAPTFEISYGVDVQLRARNFGRHFHVN
jgi:hypothetical protein